MTTKAQIRKAGQKLDRAVRTAEAMIVAYRAADLPLDVEELRALFLKAGEQIDKANGYDV